MHARTKPNFLHIAKSIVLLLKLPLLAYRPNVFMFPFSLSFFSFQILLFLALFSELYVTQFRKSLTYRTSRAV